MVYGWLITTSSVFVAGLAGCAATVRHVKLRKLSYVLAAKSADGLLMGVGAALLIRNHGRGVHIGPASAYLWLWLLVRGIEAIATWLFVLDIMGKTSDHDASR